MKSTFRHSILNMAVSGASIGNLYHDYRIVRHRSEYGQAFPSKCCCTASTLGDVRFITSNRSCQVVTDLQILRFGNMTWRKFQYFRGLCKQIQCRTVDSVKFCFAGPPKELCRLIPRFRIRPSMANFNVFGVLVKHRR